MNFRNFLLGVILGICVVQKCQSSNGYCKRRIIDPLQKEMICVCTVDYCDDFPPLGELEGDQIAVYTSSIDGKRFYRSDSRFGNTTANDVNFEITLNTSITYQKIIGFGAAFTDTAGINLLDLTEDMQRKVMGQLFSSAGIELNMARVPMAASDMSLRIYSYCDTKDDFDMETFALTREDYELKIPFIKMANEFTGNKLKLFAGIWSPPGWMKETDKMKGGGQLKGNFEDKYYAAFPKYFIRFFEEYAKNNVTFWGLGVQNEPSLGVIINYWWPQLYYSASMEREFVKRYLAPAIRSNPVTKHLKIMVNDDQRILLPGRADEILNDTVINELVDGIAVHWYFDFILPPQILSVTHDRHPDKFILGTEACNGYFSMHMGPTYGNWGYGLAYAINIMEDLQNWSSVDVNGGPNYVENLVDASIIINRTSNEFYKQPTFYTLGHFSKFLRPDSVRVDCHISNYNKLFLDAVAFKNPDDLFVVIMLNRSSFKSVNVRVVDPEQPGRSVDLILDPDSITTLVWKSSETQ